MVAIVSSSRSKYATVAAARLAALAPLMEVFFVAAILFTMLRSGGATVESVASLDSPNALGAPLVGLTMLVFTLFEARRAPFDHAEAESELVAGHLVEFGGRTLLIFFICEYIHVYFCIFFINTFVLGGGLSLDVVLPFAAA